MWVSVGPCSLSEDAQEIFVWHPTLHGLLALCLYVYVVVVSDHFLRLLVIDLEKFSPFLIFSFAEFKPKHKKKKLLLTYMHSIAYYYYNYFNVHTTERLPPPTRRFFMPQDYLQFLLSTRIIMQSLLLLLLILLTTLYYCHFWKKKHFWRVTNVVFFVVLKN